MTNKVSFLNRNPRLYSLLHTSSSSHITSSRHSRSPLMERVASLSIFGCWLKSISQAIYRKHHKNVALNASANNYNLNLIAYISVERTYNHLLILEWSTIQICSAGSFIQCSTCLLFSSMPNTYHTVIPQVRITKTWANILTKAVKMRFPTRWVWSVPLEPIHLYHIPYTRGRKPREMIFHGTPRDFFTRPIYYNEYNKLLKNVKLETYILKRPEARTHQQSFCKQGDILLQANAHYTATTCGLRILIKSNISIIYSTCSWFNLFACVFLKVNRGVKILYLYLRLPAFP